jgi:hypothetical protein
VGIPVGDVLRSFVNPNSFLGRILAALKGTKITTSGGTEILLDERGGATPPRTGLDQPHKFEPPAIGGRRR